MAGLGREEVGAAVGEPAAEVDVTLEAGEAKVSYDPATVSANALRAVIEEAGFDAA